MSPFSYQQALDYLYSFVDYENFRVVRNAANYDLRRVDELLGLVGNPHLKARTVHIAGTKGKGSTAAMITAALVTSGYKTALYTSPHLYDVRERFRVNDIYISQQELIKLTEQLEPQVEAVNYRATYGSLTTFEIMTVLAFLHFARQNVTAQVIEAGLGGRLDATNVVKPELCLLTKIDLDHTDILGKSLKAVAKEKAGIIKKGAVVVSTLQHDEVMRVIKNTAANKGVRLVIVGKDVSWESRGFEEDRQLLLIKGRLAQYGLSLPFSAIYQQENAALALATLETLSECGFSKLTPTNIVKGLEEVSWRGRFQILHLGTTVILDGAHNEMAARALADSLARYLKARQEQGKKSFSKIVLLMGVSCDKDPGAIARILKPLVDEVIVTNSHHPCAMPARLLAEGLIKQKIKAKQVPVVVEALKATWRRVGVDGLVLVTGSLFVVGEALEYLEKKAIF